MKDCGLKELSLGYNLDLDETPGVWTLLGILCVLGGVVLLAKEDENGKEER